MKQEAFTRHGILRGMDAASKSNRQKDDSAACSEPYKRLNLVRKF